MDRSLEVFWDSFHLLLFGVFKNVKIHVFLEKTCFHSHFYAIFHESVTSLFLIGFS